MTFKEMLLRAFPEADFEEICWNLCPYHFGLEEDRREDCDLEFHGQDCDLCWEREMPERERNETI